MEMIYYCKQCGNEKTHHIEENGMIPRLYCNKCGSSIKWLSKKELKVLRNKKNSSV